jgi:peroxiredoxin
MHRRSLVLAASALFFAKTSNARTRPDIGARAPSFVATDSTGDIVRLQDSAGRVVVLEWTNPECPFAGKHYVSGNMQRLQETTRSGGGLWYTVLSLPPGSFGHVDALEAEALIERRQSRANATLLDPRTEVASLYGALTTPHVFIIDREGQLAYQGGVDSIASTKVEDISRAVPYVRRALDALATGGPIDPSVTRPYGCPVPII